MPVLLAKVVDARVAGLEHSQPEQTQHRDQGEVERVRRRTGSHDHGQELQMRQAQRRRLGRTGGRRT